MPSRPDPRVPLPPPSGASRVDPTVTDDGPSLVARAKKQAGAPPSSQPPQPFATPTAQPARPKPKSGVLQSPFFIVGACLISILGVWLLVTLLRPHPSDPAAASASGDLEDEPPPANAAPVPIEQASGAPAASTTPTAQPSKSAPPSTKHRRRHRR